MKSLEWTFREAQEYGRAVLIGHLPAGFPDLAGSVRALRVLSRHVDVLEVGLPHPRRELDGADLHDASRRAVAAGITTADVIEVLREVTASVSVPVLLRSAWEPVRRHGPPTVAAALAGAGAAGAVLPDLHPHSQGAAQWLLAAHRHRLVTPFSATGGQALAAAGLSSGWVHLPVNRDPALDLDAEARRARAWLPETTVNERMIVESLRARAWMLASIATAPVCAGGDFLRPGQVAEIATAVDAIEVSDPFVRAVQLALNDRTFDLLDRCAADYAAAVRGGAHERRRPAA